MHRDLAAIILAFATVFFMSACSRAISTTERAGVEGWTGDDEIDQVIRIVLSGDVAALRSIVQFTKTECTSELGLGGPPKCEDGEIERKSVEVLPFLGWEGYFIRKEDIGSWEGLAVSEVYAVYTVSDLAYTDPNYPKGTHAIVFTNMAQGSAVTLQIDNGKIVRVDMFEIPPDIREVDVESYLLPPQ